MKGVGQIRVTFQPDQAREWLAMYIDVLEGRGCGCVKSGRLTEPCETTYKGARLAQYVVVEGHPELAAELRAAAERILAMDPSRA
jgi:hypothetical protein